MAESSIRAYVITQNTYFRSRFESAASEVPAGIAALARLVADNPGQTARVRLMEHAASQFLKFQREQSELVAQGQPGLAANRTGHLTGDQYFNSFLEPMTAFLGEEERLAAARHANAYESNRIANLVVLGGMLLNVALAGGLALLLPSPINRRLGGGSNNAGRVAEKGAAPPPLERVRAG